MPAGKNTMSACRLTPIQILDAFPAPAPAVHLPSLHRLLSQSSSESQSSPSVFLPAHFPLEHVPLVHSLSGAAIVPSSPSCRRTSRRRTGVCSNTLELFEQSSPSDFFFPPQPGKSGGHSPLVGALLGRILVRQSSSFAGNLRGHRHAKRLVARTRLGDRIVLSVESLNVIFHDAQRDVLARDHRAGSRCPAS